MERVDVVVVGGGIAGASAAYELAAAGTVVLLERETSFGHHTTGRSAALYTETYETGPVRRLTLASRPFLESPPEGFAGHPLLRALPLMWIARHDQRHRLETLAADVADLTEVRLLDRDAALERFPALAPVIVAALEEPHSREIDVAALLDGYLRGARRRGARTLGEAPVTGIRRHGALWEIAAGEHLLRADVVVDAAGAWADEIAELAGLRPLGLSPLRRTAFTFAVPGVEPRGWAMIVDVDETFYVKPEGDGFLASPEDETPSEPCDARAEEIDVALAIDRIQRATTLRVRTVRRAWAGLRTFAPDRLPVVGFDPDAAGFLWLAGQGGFGIMTAPAMARAAAGLVVDGELPADLVAAGLDRRTLSPVRFR